MSRRVAVATVVKLTNNVERSPTQSLAQRIKEDEDEIGSPAQPIDSLVHVKRVLHVPVHKAGGVNER